MNKKLLTQTTLIIGLLLAIMFVAACVPVGQPAPEATPTTPPVELVDLWAEIQKEGTMVVGVSADYRPFEYYDAKFRLDGFDIALMKAVGEELGVDIELKDFAFDGLGGALSLGQIDAAISAISVTSERREYVDFSDIYFIGSDAVLVAEDSDLSEINTPEEIAPLRVGVEGGTVYENFVQNQLVEPGYLAEENVSIYNDVSQAVRDLKRGLIDAVLLDEAPAQEYVLEGGVRIVGDGLNQQRYAIAIPLNQSPLRRVINQALDRLKADGVVSDLAKTYLDLEPEDIVPIPSQPTTTPAPVQPTPTPPQGCIDGMAWVADLTYDDKGMTSPPVIPPGQSFEKSWRIRNSGTCTWDGNYYLNYDHGNVPAAKMQGQPTAIKGLIKPGDTYDIKVNLVAPTVPGVYQGFWQMHNGDGDKFGQTIWVGIRVPPAPQPTAAPTQTPSPDISFTVNTTNINQGQCVAFQWNVTDVQAVYFYPDGQDWQNNGVAGQGSSTQCPAVTTTYYLRVVNNDGTVETRSITIYVTPVANAPQIAAFSLNPSSLQTGQCLVAQWDVQGSVTDVTLLRGTTVLWDGAPYHGSFQDCPPGNGQIGYTLKATGAGGVSQAVQYANVSGSQPTATPVPPTITPVPPTATPAPTEAAPPVIDSFNADPSTINAGQCTDIFWNTSGGTVNVNVSRDGNVLYQGGNLQGSTQDCLSDAGSYTYSLVATNSTGGAVQQGTTLQANQAPLPPSVDGSWTLIQMNGAGVVPGVSVTAIFAGGQLSGSGGCNTYNSTYETNDGYRLLINPVSGTQIACDPAIMDQENTYFDQLPQMTRYTQEGQTLTLTDSNGSLSMVFDAS